MTLQVLQDCFAQLNSLKIPEQSDDNSDENSDDNTVHRGLPIYK